MTADRAGPVPLRLRPRSVVALLLVSVVGVAAFGWPLLARPSSGLAHATDAPLLFALLLPLLLAVVLAELSEGGMDAKTVAMLGYSPRSVPPCGRSGRGSPASNPSSSYSCSPAGPTDRETVSSWVPRRGSARP